MSAMHPYMSGTPRRVPAIFPRMAFTILFWFVMAIGVIHEPV